MTATGLEDYIVFVPNTLGPYGYEMVQVLAYPRGFHFRFRFDEEWVDQKVRNRLQDLRGKSGYILLRDFASAQFLPIRFISLKTAEKVGPIYYFECELRELMDVATEDTREAQLADFRHRFNEFHPQIRDTNTRGKHLTPLVFLSNFCPDLRNENFVAQGHEDPDSSRWMNIVSSTRNVEYFRNVEFLRILSITDHSNTCNQLRVKGGAWTLKESATYSLKIAQFIPRGKASRETPNDIKLKADEAVIKVVRGEQRAVGKYDILTFVVRVRSMVRSSFSFIDLEYRPATEVQENIEPRISVPIQIQRSSKRAALRFFFAISFLAFYLFPNIASYIPLLTAETLKDVGIIGLAVTIVDVMNYLKRRGKVES